MTLLKTPINLNELECLTETVAKKRESKRLKKLKPKSIDIDNKLRHDKAPTTTGYEESKIINLSILKEPISLESIEWGNEIIAELAKNNSITFNVKTIPRTYLCGPSRRRINAIEYQAWKQNALTLFQYTTVYPFIYGSNTFKCFICSLPILEASQLRFHTFHNHTIEELKRELNNRARDKNLKVDVSSMNCNLCLHSAPDLQTLKIHLKSVHNKDIDPEYSDNVIPFKLGGKTFDCQLCNESFLKIRLLIIHMSKHFKNFSCEVCGSVFISLNLLKRHLQTHESGSFPCDKCDKVFANAAKRSVHRRGVHMKLYPRRCPICPERFNSNYQRTKHLRIIHNQTTGLFRCETCGREYDLKSHLLIHIRSVHLQERNHECGICQARFFSKELLNRHMVIHTGEKNFKCEICGKAYARRKNLREHSRTHDVGQVGCTVCGQIFVDNTALVAHIRTSHSIL